MKGTFLKICLMVVWLFACTEKVPIQPIFTGDTNWAPKITTVRSNYRRFYVTDSIFSGIPENVQRNILNVVIQIKKEGENDFQTVDTTFLYGYQYVPYWYTSKPILEEDASYQVRWKVQFRDGSSKFSNTVSFYSPTVKGKILKSLPSPDFTAIVSSPYLSWRDVFLFYQGDLYILNPTGFDGSGGILAKMDTTSGNVDILLTNLDIGTYLYIYGATILNDTLYFLDSNTLRAIPLHSPVLNNITTLGWGNLIGNNGDDLLLLKDVPGGKQIFAFDPLTRTVTDSFPTIQINSPVSRTEWPYYRIIYTGSEFWIMFVGFFDNRLYRLNPHTGELDLPNRVPVFDPTYIAYDGTHFWIDAGVSDYSPRKRYTINKIELQGL